MTDELWRRGARQLAADIAAKRITSREVVEAHLARIAAVNPAVNAVVKVLADDARRMADNADRAVSEGRVLGPLHGVPMTIKENIDVAGQATTHGVPLFAEAIAPVTAPAVERMLAAGAIPIGRTNLPDMGLRIHTDSSLHGRTKNPWKSDRTAGGSSGGEGAALATGMSPIGLGNDIGGSLRNPAHACGIASIKPSVGVIADAQTYPSPDRSPAFQTMAVQGVMARNVGDVRTGFEIVAGPDPRDPVSLPVRLTDLAAGERLTVAILPAPPGGSTHPDIAAAVRRAGDALADAGHNVVEATPPDIEMTYLVWAMMLFSELGDIRDQLDMVMGVGGRTLIAKILEFFPRPSNLELYGALSLRDGLARQWSMWFETHQALVMPTWTQPPFVFDDDLAGDEGAVRTLELMRPVTPGNVLGLPSVVTPAGMADELPVGVQVMGARFTDLRCLALAEQIEQRVPWTTPIDPRP